MNKKSMTIVVLILFMYVIVSYAIKDIRYFEKTEEITISEWLWDKFYFPSNSPPMVDMEGIYDTDIEDVAVEKLYVTVLPTVDKDGKKITFDDLNSVYDWTVEAPELNISFSDTENLEPDPSGQLSPLGIITLRGHSTIESEQKSYKLKLSDGQAELKEIDTIHLNKHPFDGFRVRNKIAFELLELVPDIISLETKLIELFVKDNSNSKDNEFKSYGLYTNIEATNSKEFLKNHGLDPEGSLYKAEFYEFLPYEDLIDRKDQNYDEEKFEKILEIKSSRSHKKIMMMNEDVNNYNLDIDRVLDKHFNRDNYFTWLAVNILLANYDTETQNFFLYSPSNTLAWYFIPWDYDGSMGEDKSLQYDKDGNFIALVGIANYWNSTLHQRVFQNPRNVEELNNKIEEIYKILSKEKMEEVVNKYMPIVKKYFMNDSYYIENYTSSGIDESAKEIVNSTTENLDLYYKHLEKPMPIYLGEVHREENNKGFTFEWNESFDLQGDRISYTLEISDTPDFQNIIEKVENIRTNYATVDIEPVDYYWRVIVSDDNGNTQRAMDMYEGDDEVIYFGVGKVPLD